MEISRVEAVGLFSLSLFLTYFLSNKKCNERMGDTKNILPTWKKGLSCLTHTFDEFSKQTAAIFITHNLRILNRFISVSSWKTKKIWITWNNVLRDMDVHVIISWLKIFFFTRKRFSAWPLIFIIFMIKIFVFIIFAI